MRFQESCFHFIGIGGIGMCGLAELLYNSGAQVTGSDISPNAQTERLQELGIKVYWSHDAANIDGATVVVYSSAISKDNVELLEARLRNIPIIPRAEALAELMRLKRGIAIAGSHGKTTTTSLVASILLHAELAPTIVVGGRLEHIQSTALLGAGDWFVAEADESDGSFAKLSPEIAIITNIDNDHLDHYKNLTNLQQAFYDFATKIPFYGQCIIYGDDPVLRELFLHFPKKIIFYGFNENNDFYLKKTDDGYMVFYHGSSIGSFQLSLPGQHNALNALSAIISGLTVGLDFACCCAGLNAFKGVARRFQLKAVVKDIWIYDDYGHHPTEIKAVLSAFKEKHPKQRLIIFFQPHRYSRTQLCWDDFLTAFDFADKIFVTNIYAAGETPQENINAKRLSAEIKHRNCTFLPQEQAVPTLLNELQPHDVFVTLGAGDGWKVGVAIQEHLTNGRN